MLEKTLESPLDCKEIQLVYPKGTHSWIFIGRTDAEVETPILWLSDVKKWLIGKTLIPGKIKSGEEKWQRMRWLDASLTRWTWVWVSSGSWWWTWKPGMLQFMGSQRVRHNWATELNCTRFTKHYVLFFISQLGHSFLNINTYNLTHTHKFIVETFIPQSLFLSPWLLYNYFFLHC